MIYEPTGREGIDHYELAFITKDGELHVFGYGYQPKTDDIADRAAGSNKDKYSMVVQKIGTQFEVYDLKTLRKIKGLGDVWTIGLPVGVHENLDAAIMSAVLLS